MGPLGRPVVCSKAVGKPLRVSDMTVEVPGFWWRTNYSWFEVPFFFSSLMETRRYSPHMEKRTQRSSVWNLSPVTLSQKGREGGKEGREKRKIQRQKKAEAQDCTLLFKMSSWKGNPPTLLVGMQTGTTAMEDSMEIPQKTEYRTTIWSRNPTPGHISGGNRNLKR